METKVRENKKFINTNQTQTKCLRIHGHPAAMEHISVAPTSSLSRKVNTLNTDEESEVSLPRLPASVQTGPHHLPNKLRVISMEMGLSRT